MANEVAKTKSAALAVAQNLKGKLRQTRAQIPDQIAGAYLRFLQDGSWVFGSDSVDVTDEKVAVNPLSIQIGWTCWTDHKAEHGKTLKNECLGEDMVGLGEAQTPKRELPDYGWPWREQVSVDVKVLTGPSKGHQLTYKTSSVGGLRALNALIDQIMLQIDEDPAHIVPQVELGGDHYNHKTWGRTYTPELRIVDWLTLDGDKSDDDQDVEEDDVDDEPAPAPTRRRAARPAPEPDVVEDDGGDDADDDVPASEEPVRRRRRRT